MGSKIYQFFKILNTLSVEINKNVEMLFKIFESSRLWGNYELWEELYLYLIE